MGLFSSKDIVYVGAQVSRTIEDEKIIYSGDLALTQALIGKTPIAPSVVNTVRDGVSGKMDKLYDYARKEYYWGLPNVRSIKRFHGNNHVVGGSYTVDETVQNAMNIYAAREVTVVNAWRGALNFTHYGRHILQNDWEWLRSTNEIRQLTYSNSGNKTYLTDLHPIYNAQTRRLETYGGYEEKGEAGSSGVSPDTPYNGVAGTLKALSNAFIAEDNGGSEGVSVSYTLVKNGVRYRDSFVISVNTMDLSREYFHCHYYYHIDGERYDVFFLHMLGDEGHPEIDAIYDPEYPAAGSYMPWVYFRRGKTNMASSNRQGTAEYESTKEMLKLIDLDYEAVGAKIASNPDIGEVEDVILMWAVDLNSEDQDEMEYLVNYYKKLQTENKFSLDVGSYLFGGYRNHNFEIADGNLKLNYLYSDITYRRIFSLNPFNRKPSYERYLNTAVEPRWPLHLLFGEERETNGELNTDFVEPTALGHTLPRMTLVHNKGELSQEQVIIKGAIGKMNIAGTDAYNVVADPDTQSYFRNATDKFLIPIDKAIVDSMSHEKKERLLQKSMIFLFTSRKVVNVKWYEQTFGLFLTTVVAAAITLYTGGQGWQIIVTAATAGTYIAAMTTILVPALKAIAMKYAFEYIAQELGPDVAFIAAVAAAIWGAGQAASGGQPIGGISASDLLQAAGGLGQASKKEYGVQLDGLYEEGRELDLLQEDRADSFETAAELLDTRSQMLTADPFMGFEDPEDFYRRTVHTGNIGTLAFDYLHSYVDVSLKLPHVD